MSEQQQPRRGRGLMDRFFDAQDRVAAGAGKLLRGAPGSSPWALGDVASEGGKSFPFNPYSGGVSWGNNALIGTAGHYGTSISYEVAAGDLIDNSAVMACLLWIMRSFTQAPLDIVKRTPDGDEIMPTHALRKLLARPNPHYSGASLWKPTLLSLNWTGDAFWRKVRNASGRTVELYYEPHWNMRPVRSSGDKFVSHYQIWRSRAWQDMPIEDVVHFRNGLDPRNDMRGLSPLASVLREVFTDNEAARYASTMLMNMGVPGVILSPDVAEEMNLDIERIKQDYIAKTTGDRRGEPLVVNFPIKAQWPTIDPAKMDTRRLRMTAEERISAVLGVAASVAGLGAGLERNTFSNSESAIRWSYTSNIIPTMMSVADDLDIQLLGEFGDPETEDIVWDLSDVAELQEDEKVRAEVTAALFTAGIMKRGEARHRHGLAVEDADDVYKVATDVASALIDAGATDVEGAGVTDAMKALYSSNGHANDHGYKSLALSTAHVAPQPRQTRRMLLAGKGGFKTRYVGTSYANAAASSSKAITLPPAQYREVGGPTDVKATARERAERVDKFADAMAEAFTEQYKRVASSVEG